MEDPRYEKFIAYLKKLSISSWHRRMGTMAQEAGISQGYLSRIINGKNIAPYNVQVAIAKACGYSYDEFLQLGQDMLQVANGHRGTTKHRSIKNAETVPCRDDSALMENELTQILKDHIETLNQHFKRERYTYERTIAELRADLERERQAHESAMAELRKEYRELKAETKELRLENKQLLEERRALQQKKAPPS
ncbi:MAG: helix-turn-helix domain-containing protein [Desulfobacterium sp.]|nr:helix-turn-helix domain-containing protein [Desulfobacterium sp.]